MYYTDEKRTQPGSIMIRLMRPTDTDELRLVAQRDSRPVPDGEMLVAIANGEIRAAISLMTGERIADPFHPTEELVRMLEMRRSQMHGEVLKPRRGLRRLGFASG